MLWNFREGRSGIKNGELKIENENRKALDNSQFSILNFLLDGGEITEVGTHEQLIALKGKYHKMYEMQASFYRNGGADDELV